MMIKEVRVIEKGGYVIVHPDVRKKGLEKAYKAIKKLYKKLKGKK